MIVEYRTNNSGGEWWLGPKDWEKLEKAGWTVVWGGNYFCQSKYNLSEIPEGKPQPCNSSDECPGHTRFDTFKEMTKKDTFLGSYAREAYKEFPTIEAAIADWEKVLEMDASDPGCSCCGQPHYFSEKYDRKKTVKKITRKKGAL